MKKQNNLIKKEKKIAEKFEKSTKEIKDIVGGNRYYQITHKQRKSLSIIKLYKISAMFLSSVVENKFDKKLSDSENRYEVITDFLTFIIKHKDEV